MKTSIVTTTINIPLLLKEYAADARKNEHQDIEFIVIGDLKTPNEVRTFCDQLQEDFSYQVSYLDVEDQKKELANLPDLLNFLPYNSIQRRNIGLLLAYRNGAENIITIDDDNFLIEDDYMGKHGNIGNAVELDAFSSSSGWFNVCELLKEEKGRVFYHRGFPLKKRFIEQKVTCETRKSRIVVNAGFWLEDPDVDAVTRIAMLPRAVGYAQDENFMLQKGTWSPFNSQNTALLRDIIPAYFLSPDVGRYDDIWASFVIDRIADHMGDAVSFGFPLVRQDRNIHNYMKDLEKEMDGMRLSDVFCEMLRAIPLQANSYQECYRELAQGLKKEIQERKINSEDALVFSSFIRGMEVWIKTFEKIV